MTRKILIRPALLSSLFIVLLVTVAACGTAATPTPVVIEKEVQVEVPVEVTKEVIVEKEVPVEVTKEVIVEKEVMVEPTPVAMPGEGVTVQPARATWNTGYFQEALVSALLEELGYDAQDYQELDNPIFYQSVSLGDVDFWANGWIPLHDQYKDTWSNGAEIAGVLIQGGGMQGYLVDKASVEEYGIQTLADFENAEVQEAFDADGDGKADLYGCPSGWGCNLVIEYQLDAFDLRDHINHVTADYSAMFADVKSRYANGEPVLYYTWAPNFTLTKVSGLAPADDVVWIEVPEFAHPSVEDANMVKIPGVKGCVADHDPCFMGFAANDIDIIANSEFLGNNPAAAKLFELIELPLSDVLAQNNRMEAGETSQDDIDRHAIEWIATHRATVDQWLEQARQAAG